MVAGIIQTKLGTKKNDDGTDSAKKNRKKDFLFVFLKKQISGLNTKILHYLFIVIR
jgi:hypothetical protein